MHTPGPWRRDTHRKDLIEGQGTHVAMVLNHFNPHRADSAGIFEANAALMAAAPDLLEALEDLITHATYTEKQRQKAQAAIAKARAA